MSEPLLQLSDLRVTFVSRGADVHAVRGVDLQVHAEETIAVVGESGSGKSVTMMATLGLLPDNASIEGAVTFAGRDLGRVSDAELRQIRGRECGVVFQDPMSSLNPVQRVRDQIAESLIVHLRQTRKQAHLRAVDLLEEVGIPDPARRATAYPHQFSGGMRQRVMIAMALACQPRLLIADEPTTALDVTVQAQITELVQRLQREHGMAVVWITHDLGVVAQMADRVSVMYAGRIVETGSCAELYAAPHHPYTVGLLTAVPRLDAPLGRDLVEIPGTPPDAHHVPRGCAFAPRCFMVHETCVQERPSLVVMGATKDRAAACWHADEVPRPAEQAVQATQPVEGVEEQQERAQGALLRIEDLKVHFGSRGTWLRKVGPVRAVDGITLDLAAGETLGLVGESGSGKSTLGRAVVGIERPTDGSVCLDGVDCSEASGKDLRRLRRTAQMVFQDPSSSMNPSLSVAEIIQEPLRINGIGNRQHRLQRSRELLELVELPENALTRFPHQFSGGQRQRIAIARALALDPSLVVCDEAVSALDVSVQAQIINLFGKLKHELGLSLLFIAHDLAVVRHIADRVAVMYLGKIVESGTRADIYDNPQHPYTRALLTAVPVVDPAARSTQSFALPGDLPSPSAPPPGCRFSTRCPFAVPGLCDVQEPHLAPWSNSHTVACHLAGGLPEDTVTPRSSDPSDERGTTDESLSLPR